jgi:SAM-dependent methyltransferase
MSDAGAAMPPPLDRRRVQQFARALFGHYTSGILTMMVQIGHETGLFEALAQAPGTSAELAARAGLSERYVREWLGAVTTGGIAEYDAASGTYRLPPEHAVCLTGSSPRNLAPRSTSLPMLAKRLTGVIDAFRRGGGVPYSAFRPDFTEATDAGWRLLYDGMLITSFLPLAGDVAARLAEGISAADVGCGTGHAVNVMARAFPRSTFVGYDIGEDAIERARAEARAMGLENARFEVLDAAALPAEPRHDLITSFDAIHDQRDPAGALSAIARALAPGGAYLMMEPRASSRLEDNIGNPIAPYMYGVSVLHCMTVSLAEGGAGLGTCWGEQTARRMLADAGFTSVEVREVPATQNSLFVCRR